jgi:hypothetical protein
MGHKNPDKFLNDPEEKGPDGQLLHPPPPPPDPKVMAVQAQAEADKAELAMKAQLDKAKAQDAAQLAQFKAEIDAKLKLIDAHMKSLEIEQKGRQSQQAHHAKMAETVVDVIATAHKHDMEIAHEQQAHQQNMEQGQQAHEAHMAQAKQKPKGGE